MVRLQAVPRLRDDGGPAHGVLAEDGRRPPDLRGSANALPLVLTCKLLLVAVRDRYGMAEPAPTPPETHVLLRGKPGRPSPWPKPRPLLSRIIRRSQLGNCAHWRRNSTLAKRVLL